MCIDIAVDRIVKARNDAYTALGIDDVFDMIDILKGIIDHLDIAEDELLEVGDD